MSERASHYSGFWHWKNPILWGLGATIAVVIVGFLLGASESCRLGEDGTEVCSTKWVLFLDATPNEVGDTLAGFAGALAFVWLIATVWLQGQELAAQRMELTDQRKATQEMARAMEAQAQVEEKRFVREEQESFDALFAERLVGIQEVLLAFRTHENSWVIADDKSTGRKEEEISLVAGPSGESSTQSYIHEEIDTFFHRSRKLLAASKGKGFKTKPFLEDRFGSLIEAVTAAIEAQKQGSPACKEKAKIMQLEKYLERLSILVSDGKLWHLRLSEEKTP